MLQSQECAFEIFILIEQRLRIGDIGGFMAVPAFQFGMFFFQPVTGQIMVKIILSLFLEYHFEISAVMVVVAVDTITVIRSGMQPFVRIDALF